MFVKINTSQIINTDQVVWYNDELRLLKVSTTEVMDVDGDCAPQLEGALKIVNRKEQAF